MASNSGAKHPDTRLFRSSDLLHPFLLAANYPNASPKLLDTSFKAMKTLMEADAICPGDGMNMVRVWMIQAQVVVSYSRTSTTATTASGLSRSSTTSKKETGISNSTSSTTTTSSSSKGELSPDAQLETPLSISSESAETPLQSSNSGGDTMSSSQQPKRASNGNENNNKNDNTTKSSSTWFGSYFSSSSSASTGNAHSVAAPAGTGEQPKSIMTSLVVSTKTAVSSSHGQAGSGHMNAKDLEKIALDILSCLLQLLELRDLPVSNEQWIQSVTLCCLLYLPLRQQIVRQAAHSTLPQVLTLLFKDEDATSLALKTWDDLLSSAVGFSSSSLSEDNHIDNGTIATAATRKRTMLHGAFCNCRLGERDTAQPPSPALSLELMATLLTSSPTLFAGVGTKTFGVIVQVLQNQTKVHSDASPMEYSKALQFVLMVLQTQHRDWPAECHELIPRLVQPVSLATEALRKQADFEDGYIYKVQHKQVIVNGGSSSSVPSTNGTSMVINSGNMETLQGLPPTVLWKAALAMETLKTFIQDKTHKDVWLHEDVVGYLLEATSDFCTIGASCEDHMNLLVMASRGGSGGQNEGNSLAYSAETLDSIERWKKGKFNDDTYVLGVALWAGFKTLLRMIELLDERVLEQSFAPSLSVLQHYLKRFPASGIIVKRSLEGYFSLAKVSLNVALLRRALLASLCKLSLPQWGSNDAASQLKDHNVAALICLLNVVHRFHDQIGQEWSLVLQTFDELSVMPIASPHLSNNAYAGALSISAVYSRLPSFSTCLSEESLSHFVAGLKEVSIAEKHQSSSAPVGGQGRNLEKINGSQEERETIGERIINIGARAIAWNTDGTTQLEDVPVAERTKNAYHDDYQTEFVNRLGSARYPIRDRQVPFSIALLADVAMSNSFRYGSSGADIFRQMCSLASAVPACRLFIMDLCAMLIMFLLSDDEGFPASFIGPSRIMYSNPRQNQYFAVEKIDSDLVSMKGASQCALLGPLCDYITGTETPNVAEVGLEALYSILESTGHELSKDAWVQVIQALASVTSPGRSSPVWTDSCQVGFRCVKLIVDDFLEDASISARTSLLDCCSMFGSSRHDVNTSLTAIGLLWTIADKDAGIESIETALAKLVYLSSDQRPEVRNCSVNTLFSCIVGRGTTFSETQWESCIRTSIFGVYDAVTSDSGGTEEISRSVETSKKKSRYRVNIHHSRDSADKQWLATQALVLRGLCRVLRNFFNSLLNTTDRSDPESSNEVDTPWFDEAWSKILGYAFDASTQTGGRDTLELRISGVELLVLCNQLSCTAGIQAAITPARVGTNMEVVNGALRTVRSPGKPENDCRNQHSHSAVAEIWRENLFLDAFDVLDSFREHLERDSVSANESSLSSHLESTQVQVLSKLAIELSKLYDCCCENEFAEDLSLSGFSDFAALIVPIAVPPGDEDPMVARFVRVVVSVATNSSSGEGSRFLSQAQRTCVDLFRTMASNGSPEAFLNLTHLASSAIFAERDLNGKPMDGVDILSFEMSSVLSQEFPKKVVSDECRAVILTRLMLMLKMQRDENVKQQNASKVSTISYAVLLPIVNVALESAKRLYNGRIGTSQPILSLLDILWENICSSLSEMLSPVPDGLKGIHIPRATDLVELVKTSARFVPTRYYADLCGILSSGARRSLEITRSAEESQESIIVNDHLSLFAACFSGACQLQPDDKGLQQIASHTLEGAVKLISTNSGAAATDRKASLLVCQVLSSLDSAEVIVIAVLSQLSQLVGAEDVSLRRSAGGVLARTNISGTVQDAIERCKTAEGRARVAEAKVTQLETEIEVLMKQKDALERQLAF
jgi:hypothetical protein